jgi:hypothetical protein
MYMITTSQPAFFVVPNAAFGLGSTSDLSTVAPVAVMGDARIRDAKQAAPPREVLR